MRSGWLELEELKCSRRLLSVSAHLSHLSPIKENLYSRNKIFISWWVALLCGEADWENNNNKKFAPQRDSNLTSLQVTKYFQGLQTVFLLCGLQRVLICFLSLKLQYVKNILERKSIKMPSIELNTFIIIFLTLKLILAASSADSLLKAFGQTTGKFPSRLPD